MEADISTWQKTGHSYFALTKHERILQAIELRCRLAELETKVSSVWVARAHVKAKFL
jgi:hypothetical protein